MGEVIQFVPASKLSEAAFYERLCERPSGSFMGVYMGVPCFEQPDTAPSEYQAPSEDSA